jgi:hypothetical protein
MGRLWQANTEEIRAQRAFRSTCCRDASVGFFEWDPHVTAPAGCSRPVPANQAARSPGICCHGASSRYARHSLKPPLAGRACSKAIPLRPAPAITPKLVATSDKVAGSGIWENGQPHPVEVKSPCAIWRRSLGWPNTSVPPGRSGTSQIQAPATGSPSDRVALARVRRPVVPDYPARNIPRLATSGF